MKNRTQLMRLLWRKQKIAKEKGVPFNLTVEDLPPIPERCPVLGLLLSVNLNGYSDDYSPSLDRVSAKLGYVPTNVIWVSGRANRIKSDAHWDELLKIGEFYRVQFPDSPLPSYKESQEQIIKERTRGKKFSPKSIEWKLKMDSLCQIITLRLRAELLRGRREFNLRECKTEFLETEIIESSIYEFGVGFYMATQVVGGFDKTITGRKRRILYKKV